MPSNTTQYTEENFSELYSNLPAGLKDLVLNGRLAILVSGVGVKNGLDADQVGDLEPSVEDVCLGLITYKDLPQNIASQVGIDISLARKIASDCIEEILKPYNADIEFARQYKLGMDERIASLNTEKANNGLPDASSLRAQILNENKAKIESDAKIANFFNKKTGEDVLENQEAEDVDTEEYEEENIETLPDNKLGALNYIAEQEEATEDVSDFVANPKTTTSFSNLINKKTKSVNDENNGATILRFEQEIATLTQSINTLIRNTPNNSINLKSVEELSVQIKKVENEVLNLKKEQENINLRIKRIESGNLISGSLNVKTNTDARPSDEKEESIYGSIKSPLNDPKFFASSVSKEAANNIAAQTENPFNLTNIINNNKKENNDTGANFSWGKKDLSFEAKNENPEIKKDMEENKKALSSVLLKDLEKLKSGAAQTSTNGEVKTTETVIPKTETASFKDELLPQSKEDRMKILQDKIRNLNQGNLATAK
jgi:hypothetical protein